MLRCMQRFLTESIRHLHCEMHMKPTAFFLNRIVCASLSLVLLWPCAANAQEIRECEILMLPIDGPYVTNTWPNGIVPYEFDANVTQANQGLMLQAMTEIENVTLIDFIPRTTQSNYIHIQNSGGNSSYVGMIGGGQSVNIFNWNVKFIMCHELIHALGFFHTQQRSDRDQYVQINWDAITSGTEGNFNIYNGPKYGPYDFDSVMHYGRCAFTNCGSCTTTNCFTIIVPAPNQAWQNLIGQRDHLSDGDVNGINFLYPPLDGSLIWVDFLHTGPSNGTAQSPYATLAEGIEAVSPGGTVRIKPGVSSETFPDGISKPVTLQAASTVVTIGQ